MPLFETPFETYRATMKIGEGGSGRVYKTIDNTNAIYAVKALSPERISTEKIKRFKNELDFCRRNRHKNIINVSDAGVLFVGEVKCPFYVMPYFPTTLRAVLPKLEHDQILPTFAEILNGIEAAHLLGVWHRDLKPENILIDGQLVVVADFGIAHFSEEEILTAVETKVASRLANHLYAAPEQKVKGGKVDHRADIYALGLILNEMFTGQVPQGAGIKPISSVSGNHAYLDDLVSQMIQQNPEKRLQSIENIKHELVSRANDFIAFQKLEESKRQVISTAEPPEFVPIELVDVDYDKGVLYLLLSAVPNQQWKREFASSHGTRVTGYEPDQFGFQDNRVSISSVNNDVRLIQKLVDYSKQYISDGNLGYQSFIQRKTDKENQDRLDAIKARVEQDEERVRARETISKITF